MSSLVGLYAPAMQSGKSTVASALAGHNYQTVKFAMPLKTMLADLLAIRGADQRIIDRMIDGDLKEAPTKWLDGKTPRHAMQTLGTEWGRNCMGEDFWVNTAMSCVDSLLDRGHNVVMDDVRFWNEAQAIKDRGGLLVHIARPGAKVIASHASEGGLYGWPFDVWLVNDKSSATEWALHACHEIGVAQMPMLAVRNMEIPG
jgi:hypothetical protein